MDKYREIEQQAIALLRGQAARDLLKLITDPPEDLLPDNEWGWRRFRDALRQGLADLSRKPQLE
jgi:hypothetical protein